MKKRLLTAFLAMVMLLSVTTVTAFAVEDPVFYAAGGEVDNFVGPEDHPKINGAAWLQEGQLHAQDGSSDKGLGEGWNKWAINNPMNVDYTDDDAFRVWKIEIDGDTPEKGHFWWYDDAANMYEEFDINNFSTSGNGAQCLLIMPNNYRLVGGYVPGVSGVSATYAGNSQKGEPAVGTVTVTAEVDAWHNEITPIEYYTHILDTYYERSVDEYYERTADEYYERTVDEFYERPVFNFYERNVDEYYERDVNEYYERPVTDIYQRYAAKYFVPVFEKKLEGAFDGTLVTRLTYDGNTAKAKPTNGGAFKNGHTYVTVNVSEASDADGIDFVIADSSKNNGKKTPDQYNRPIEPGYTYNVKIEGGKLTVTFPEDLAYASVGAMVWDQAPKDAKNAPKHFANTVTVDVPKNDGTVDLYVHIERLGWYDLDKNGEPIYIFKEWKYDHTEYGRDWVYVETTYGDYELVETVKGDWEKVDTKYGEYELVKTTYGDYVLVDTKYGDYEKVGETQYGEYELVDTVYGDYELVNEVKGESVPLGNQGEQKVRVEDTYTGTLILTVDGVAAELGTELTLAPGEHTFVLSGEGFEDVTETVVVEAGESKSVVISAECQYADVTKDPIVVDKETVIPHYSNQEAEKHYADKATEKHYSDKEAVRHEGDGKVDDNYADRTATIHSADREAEKHYADGEVSEVFKEEYIYRPDVKLGNETDPDGEYAVKVN